MVECSAKEKQLFNKPRVMRLSAQAGFLSYQVYHSFQKQVKPVFTWCGDKSVQNY